MKSILKIWLLILAIPKTVYFNFKYLRFREAIKLPILVSHRVYLKETRGKVFINSDIKSGMIKIGFGEVGIFDQVKSRTIWQVSGTVIFNGKASIGHGSKISVRGKISIGKNFIISAESQIVCHKQITIGNDVLLSWDILIMDTDFHEILDVNGARINNDKEIVIGNKVWIGCRSILLKGTTIGNNVVIAANTLLNGRNQFNNIENVIIGGNPAKILKEGITWNY